MYGSAYLPGVRYCVLYGTAYVPTHLPYGTGVLWPCKPRLQIGQGFYDAPNDNIIHKVFILLSNMSYTTLISVGSNTLSNIELFREYGIHAKHDLKLD